MLRVSESLAIAGRVVNRMILDHAVEQVLCVKAW